MKENIIKLAELGKIPDDSDMSDEEFRQYESLICTEEPLTYEEAEVLITLFSDDCCDLNWGLLHAIETVDLRDTERYRTLISKCSNSEFRETLAVRLENYLKQHK